MSAGVTMVECPSIAWTVFRSTPGGQGQGRGVGPAADSSLGRLELRTTTNHARGFPAAGSPSPLPTGLVPAPAPDEDRLTPYFDTKATQLAKFP
jgi:hypothetical protein